MKKANEKNSAGISLIVSGQVHAKRYQLKDISQAFMLKSHSYMELSLLIERLRASTTSFADDALSNSLFMAIDFSRDSQLFSFQFASSPVLFKFRGHFDCYITRDEIGDSD